MSRNTKHKLYKRLLELQRRGVEINEIQKNLGYVELEKPIHHGYTARFVLRDDIARREDAHVFLHLIEKYSTIGFSKTKMFYVKKKGYYVDSRPKLKYISETEYLKLSTKMQSFFYYSPSKDKKSWDGSVYKFYQCYLPDYYLVMKIEKDYITHRKVIDGELEREEAFIDKEIRFIYQQMNPFNDGMKLWGKYENRKDRRYNKMAVRHNLKTEEFINSEYHSYGTLWSDDPKELKYKHRHGARWMRW